MNAADSVSIYLVEWAPPWDITARLYCCWAEFFRLRRHRRKWVKGARRRK